MSKVHIKHLRHVKVRKDEHIPKKKKFLKPPLRRAQRFSAHIADRIQNPIRSINFGVSIQR